MYDALSIPNFNDAFNAGTCELDQLFIVQPAINDGFKNQVSNTTHTDGQAITQFL